MWMFLKPGINDDNLGWPFTKKVAFTLEAGGKKIEKVFGRTSIDRKIQAGGAWSDNEQYYEQMMCTLKELETLVNNADGPITARVSFNN